MRLSSGTGLVFALCVAGCHLADDPEPITCEPGTHPENGRCLLDPFEGQVVTITGAAEGTSCSVTPELIRVAPSVLFIFKNEDAVEHVIRGDDGQVWATAKASQLSPEIGITRAGTWRYQVSECASGGTVVVE